MKGRDASHIVITTPWADTPANESRAGVLQALFGGVIEPRKDRSVVQILADTGADVLVVSGQPPTLFGPAAPTQGLFFHPSLAVQRIAKLRRGERDRLVDTAHIRPGDRVVDATLGLGADALVLAQAVGTEGAVTACEASWPLACLFRYAAQTADLQDRRVQPLFDRIHVQPEGHESYLSRLLDDSVDVVYFDPMFRVPPDRTSAIDPMRTFSVPSPISHGAFAEAMRVARRCVVLKERAPSGEFERFGMAPDRPRARFAYGVRWKHKE